MIKSRLPTDAYRNNHDLIFKKEQEMVKFIIPAEFAILAKTNRDAEKQLNDALRLFYREYAATYNIIDYEASMTIKE